ncbi:imelysin family protein [Marinobacterium sp. D7]|uniref:imelysin family protein n=1 Tax=Marinobacterium ramblicola TaxID=2849041 RepID=UPI001C2DEA28|nr:imelysin family protein [Marinobacterium ramblicola]MBV1789303.1 imelysin family protein [Marinobacterium ramblicola]
MKRRINTSLLPTLVGASALFLLAGLLHGNHAAAQSVNWQAYNEETLHEDILPAYAHFASAAEGLAKASNALCNTTDSANLASTRQAYRDTLTAWQGVSHLQFGPVTYLMRNYSIQFWPDRKSIGRKQLQSALALPADSVFDAEFFHQASVSIKGLPALEQLLFRTDALEQLQGIGVDCRLTQAIAGNLSTMADGIYQDWKREGETLLRGSDIAAEDDVQASTVPAFSIDLMKSLVEPIELIRDTKLLAVLGKGADSTYPHRAESWMSEHSLANIRTNLDAAQALYKGSNAGLEQLLRQRGEEERAKAIEQQFLLLDEQLQPLGDSLTGALDAHYAELVTIADSLKVLDHLLGMAMKTLGIQLGFNSRDGD